MQKNVKSIFLVATLLFLLVGVSAISASEVSNGTTVLEDTTDTVAPEITTSDKIVDTTTKNIKTEEQSTDLYVSDADGSDDNSGTNISPYKTIQKALDTTTADSTYNIHIAEGTYKGLGNTNLTVNGNYKINFIGDGNATIDGEVNYTYHVTQEGDYFWGSSKIWEPYDNGTGNWAMKITTGNGLITISNLTIQNCWNPGGASIELYPTSTIDNYGNLIVDNVSFIFNHGGTGGAIRNNNGATITVNNSLFDGNRKSSQMGNYGAGIYNNGTATVINSTFQNNYARWGTITNDKKMSIINCTIRDNIAYDGGSTYKTGSGITESTRGTNFYDASDVISNELLVDGCVFINNQQADIYCLYGKNVIINNSLFNNSVGIYRANNATITNNIFDSPIGNTIQNSLSITSAPIMPIVLNSNSTMINNTVINNINTNVKSTDLIIYNNNNTVYNNSFNRIIEINSRNNLFYNNTVITSKDGYAVNLTTGAGNNSIFENYLQSTGLVGDEAVSPMGRNNISNNLPRVTSITINEEQIDHYFENGQLKNKYNSVETIKLNGTISNHDLIFDLNHPISITQLNWQNYNYNFTITIKEGTTATISQLTINNTIDTVPIVLESEANSITRNTIQTPNEYAITTSTTGNTITSNTLYADIFVGNDAVEANEYNTVTGNTPTYTNYLLNDTTYSQYFNEEGYYDSTLGTDVHFLINGILSNKDLILQNSTINITKRNDESIIYNTTITSKDSNTIILTNTIINNTNKLALNISTISPLIENNTIITQDTTAILIHDIDSSSTGNLRINANNITVSGSDITTITAYNITSYGNNNYMGASNIYNNTITMNGENITVIHIYNSTFSSVAQNTINAIGTNVIGINISNDIINPLNVTVANRAMPTTTIVSNNVLNIQADNNAIGLITENLSLHMTANDLYNVESNRKINFNITSNNTLTAWKIKNVSNTTSWGQDHGETTSYKKIRFNLNAKNEAVGIVASGYSNIMLDYLNMTLSGEKTTAIELINTAKEVIGGNIIQLYGKNNTAINVINSTDIIIKNMKILDENKESLENSLIDITDSWLIYVESNTIKGGNYYTVSIIDSNDSRVTNNILYTNNGYGDETVFAQNNVDTYTTGNIPVATTEYLLIDSNYEDFFDESGKLKNTIPENSNIQIIGDLYNKNMILNKKITITQSEYTTLYNTTITVNSNNILLNNINITNENKNALIINGNNNTFHNFNIFLTQSTTDSHPVIINGDNNTFKTNKFNITGKGELIKETTLITINGENNNIITQNKDMTSISTISANKINNLTILSLNNTQNNQISLNTTVLSEINNTNTIKLMNSNNNTINYVMGTITLFNGTIFSLNNSSENHITLLNFPSTGNCTSILLNNNSNNNYITGDLDGLGTGYPILINNSNNNTIKSVAIRLLGQGIQIMNSDNNEFLLNNINDPSYEGIAINISEGRNNYIHHNSIKTKTHGGDTAVLQEVIGESTIQNPVNNNYYQKSQQWNEPYNPLRTSINVTNTLGYVGETIELNIELYALESTFSTTPQPVTSGTLIITMNNEQTIMNVEDNKNYTLNYTITNKNNQQIFIEYYPINEEYEPTSITANISTITQLTDENYEEYFTDSTLNDNINTIELASDIFNKDMILPNKITFLNPNNYTLYNTTITIGSNSLSNLKIENEGQKTAIIIDNNGIITNSTITHKGDYSRIVVFKDVGGNIQYSNITATGQNNIVFSGTTSNVNNNGISYNNINVNGNKTIILDVENRISSIYNNITYESNNTSIFKLNRHITNMNGGSIQYNNININGNNLTLFNITKYQMASMNRNNITMDGSNIIYMILSDTQKTFSSNLNNIVINTNTPNTKIIIDNSKITMNRNNITINTTQENTPIITSNSDYQVSITNNYIESKDLCGNDAVSGATTISGNSPVNNAGYIARINIEDTTIPQYQTTTIPIILTDAFGQTIDGTITATINGNQATIENNNLIIKTNTTDNITITARYTDSTGKYNSTTITKTLTVTPAQLTIDPITATVENTINITARITAGNETLTDINKGKVTFKVNGKTLKDANGKVIYAKVINGIATIENYVVPEDWSKDGTTIQAIYSGSTQCEKLTSEKTNITVATPKATLTITPITSDIQAGSTVTLKAKVAVGDKAITTGKIVFKINGKTVKDENGKVIYAKVDANGEVSVDYTIPESFKAGTYNIEAVFTASGYDKLTSNTTMTVVKS